MSPYKHPRITYGTPADSMPVDLIEEYVEDLAMAIGLSRQPVGVKLILSPEEYEQADYPEPKTQLAYCSLVERASRGKAMKTKQVHHKCDGGTTALALESSNERIESGLEYFSYNLYASPAVARRIRQGVPGLYRYDARTYGIITAPLAEMEIIPDVVIIIANPYQVMRLTQGNVYHSGERLNISTAAMQAICAEITIQPYLTGKMSLSPLCPSTRMLAGWKDDEMAVGLPFEQFIRTVEGVIATINSTDIKKRKEQIMERFQDRGKILDLSLDNDYEP